MVLIVEITAAKYYYYYYYYYYNLLDVVLTMSVQVVND